MFRHLLDLVVFSLGLVAVCWIGAGYLGSNPLALAITLLIGAGYVAGGIELLRYRRATSTLQRSVIGLSAPPSGLGDWLAQLDPSLRNAVHQRIEGQRVALPGPALTPYLAGLLVLLGMLGTLLGMMAMLRGTGLALETATDLQAIRDSLAAPVKGLGFAFGTSIAGVASSAMLGLLSALCRRDRLQVVQLLDAKIATTLRVHSQAHQREEAFRLLQKQTELMPALVDRLQTMMSAIEQQSLATGERQIASQDAFHGRTEAVYAQLAASVQQSLQKSIADSVHAASEALQPVMYTTMAAMARETAALRDTVAQAVERQLQALSTGFESTTTTVADIWNRSLAGQQQTNETLTRDLHGALDQFAATFEQRSASLLDGVSARLGATADTMATAWSQALSQQQDVNAALAAGNQDALAAAAATLERHSAALLGAVDRSHAELTTALAAQDQQRLAAWTASLAAMSTALREDWAQAGADTARRQQEICDTLARTADGIGARSQAHASDTIAEISRLVDTASEAPKAAAEVIAELRQKLSDSMVRDTAMLAERTELMATLETLLTAVNHASTEQRTAIDALVATSSDLLDRVGTRFGDQIEAETGKLGAVADRITVGAVEVASLGEAFGTAAQIFGEANDKLANRLQGIEEALTNSIARSDEQLAYYVAQAREVIDLSMLAQKQIVEDMQRISGPRALAAGEAA
ncbi:DUF802 domain-containing protein [Pseudoxanthomonas wuyuanensis]